MAGSEEISLDQVVMLALMLSSTSTANSSFETSRKTALDPGVKGFEKS